MHEAEQYFGGRLPLLAREAGPAYVTTTRCRPGRAHQRVEILEHRAAADRIGGRDGLPPVDRKAQVDFLLCKPSLPIQHDGDRRGAGRIDLDRDEESLPISRDRV